MEVPKMRNYRYVDQYLTELLKDIYPQPPDPGHTRWAAEVINNWVTKLAPCKSVLDVGCGEAFCQPIFENLRIEYTGVNLGIDFVNAKMQGRNVYQQDFSFLEFPDNSFDLIFARHALEHSPMPVVTLMEWYRVSKQWLCLVMPTPRGWGWVGRNHYSVLSLSQNRFLLERAGWKTIWEDHSEPREYRFMVEKIERVSLVEDTDAEFADEE